MKTSWRANLDGFVKKDRVLRCAASFVIAEYVKVRLIPQDLHALPAELFAKPSQILGICDFYEIGKSC
jgi:hypothetical protein